MSEKDKSSQEDRTAVLYRVSKALIGLDTLSSKLKLVADSAAEVLQADWTIVLRMDMEHRRVIDSVSSGIDPPFNTPYDFEEMMEGLTGWAIEHRTTVLSPKGEDDPRESERVRNKRRRFHGGAIMVAPLLFGEHIVGTITAVNTDDHPDFTREDILLLDNLANLAAAAIENSRLYDDLNEELSRRRKTERELHEREEKLERALQEKNLLLREIHHRVKNNLAIVESLISLKTGELEQGPEREVLEDLRIRIDAIRLLHQKLYAGSGSNTTPAQEYLDEILQNGRSLVRDGRKHVELESSVEEVDLPVNTALYLGLIITEAVTNAIKYAFPDGSSFDGSSPKVSLSFYQQNGSYHMEIRDNGTGIPEDKLEDQSGTMGIRMIHTLAEQLDGSAAVEVDGGTIWTLTISQPAEAEEASSEE
jgi:two-component sensor histidine kinase